MQSFRASGLLLLIWSALLAGPASAETLPDRQIQNFIASLVELNAKEEEFADLKLETAQEQEMPDFEHLISSSIRKMEGHPGFQTFKDVIEDHGFDSPAQWGETGDRIFRAWMAIEMEQQGATMNQDMARAMAEIDSNPHMTQAQKDQMKAMMGGAMSAMEQAQQAPAADVQALRPHLDDLRAATDDEDAN
ncbi:hypothetical protein [Marinobacter sp. SS21]|uniref:hypothetical protein n=1 Tax=Marinobacter sp. SS21 TaxID=2979460 RepID=UPI00232CA96D|nr:hypothetical protein [Marinobacter sp. SS21]MDC0661160.1 hypothetical protein [Marinobacter sp. SS21]